MMVGWRLGSARRYKFSATVSVEARSAEEARRVIDREMNGARLPLARRLGRPRKVRVKIDPEPFAKT